MFPQHLVSRASQFLDTCRLRGVKVVTAESCTGGLIAGLLTEFPGSSDVVERGFVTYSNDAKSDCLGVDALLIDRVGAVSREVASAMAEGALVHSQADIAIAVTGVAGPGGGTAAKPVGLVYIATRSRHGAALVREYRFGDDRSRQEIRLATIAAALDLADEVM